MKCKDCTACKRGYFKSVPDAYVCTGVPEPFVIGSYVDAECTAYPEKNNTPEQSKCKYVVACYTSASSIMFKIFDTRTEATLYINERSCAIYTHIVNEDDSNIDVNCNCRDAYARVTCGDTFWSWKLCEVKF